MKRTLIYKVVVIALVIVIGGYFMFKSQNSDLNTVNNQTATNSSSTVNGQSTSTAIDMCYFYSKDTTRGLADRAWLKMSILGDRVSGEYQNIPAEKDRKTGKFEGIVGTMNPATSARIAEVWWDSLQEGMNVTEQLKIQFGEGSAVAVYGEMVDRGDGVYLYKENTKLTAGFQMSQIDCDALDDMTIVEKYIRDNIKNIVPNKEVLGGSWYVTLIKINPSEKTGTVAYEDGHIVSKASFSYTREDDKVVISNIKLVK